MKKNSTKKPIPLFTEDEVFAPVAAKKRFVSVYNEEVARLHLVREIRELRTKNKLTQATLAKQADMPQSVIARIESGEHSFTVETLQRIATVFEKQIRLV